MPSFDIWCLFTSESEKKYILKRERASHTFYLYTDGQLMFTFLNCWIFSILPPLYSFHFISFHFIFIYFLWVFAKYFRYSCRDSQKKSFSFNEMFLFYDDYDIQPLVLIAKKNVFWQFGVMTSQIFALLKGKFNIIFLFWCSFVIFTTLLPDLCCFLMDVYWCLVCVNMDSFNDFCRT